MGNVRRAEVKSAVELGWRLPAAAGALVVVGADGGHTTRFILTGPPEHRQLVRYNKDGQATTARPAMREEDYLFNALVTLWSEHRDRSADLVQAHRQIENQTVLIEGSHETNGRLHEQIANQAGQIELLLARPTAEEHERVRALLGEAERDRDRLAGEVHELADSNEILRTGIRELQERLARCEAEKAGQLRFDVEGK